MEGHLVSHRGGGCQASLVSFPRGRVTWTICIDQSRDIPAVGSPEMPPAGKRWGPCSGGRRGHPVVDADNVAHLISR
jgi:hypothetical protein